MVQPGEVWRVMLLVVWRFTPSIMSISPEEGQLGPNICVVSAGWSRLMIEAKRMRDEKRRRKAAGGRRQRTIRTQNAGQMPQAAPGM